MTNDQVHTALNQWIRSKTGNTTVIKAHQGGTAPALPYIMTNFTGSAEVRRHQITVEYTDTGVANSAGENIINAAPVIEMEWRFSVHAYGLHPIDPATGQARSPVPTAPTDIIRPIVSAMKLSQASEPLMPGMHVHEISQIRNVPDWIETAWQPRAQMDLFVRGIIRDAHLADVIDEYSFDIAQMSAE